ncbi:MAG TPA: hypothetical protein VH092_08660 [Urbifossiella sp.]|jgi:pilus assembly protein CpaE|nr:hypothetical protein [Urbifossiella sp.]
MYSLIVSPSPDDPVPGRLARLVQSRPGFHDLTAVGLDRAEAACRSDRPDVVIAVLAAGEEDRVLGVVRRVAAAGPGFLLVVGPATDPRLILRAMQAGADLFLDEADLAPQLDAALTRFQVRRGEPVGPGRLIAVLAAAGGCGASTVAVNLAAVVARARGRCNLIDLNPRKADLAPLLDLKPTYTLADLCRNEGRLDRTLFEKLLTRHPTGVELLAAPKQFDDARALTPGAVAEAVRLAREAFGDVVVDLEDCFHPEQGVVLDQATTVLVVCRLDFTAVRNARRVLDHLAARGVPRDRVEVVVNLAGRPGELPVAEAELALGVKVARFVPHDPETIGWSNNTGIPAAVTAPGSAVVQGIARIVGLETPPPVRPPLAARVWAWARVVPAARCRALGPHVRAGLARLRGLGARARAARRPLAPPPTSPETLHELALAPRDTATATRSWPA